MSACEPQGLHGDIPLDQAVGGLTEQQCVRRRQPLKPRRHVGHLAQGELLLAAGTTHRPDDDQARVDAHSDSEPDAPVPLQAGVQPAHGVKHAEARAYGPQGIVFVRLRPAEVDQQPIAKQLGDMTVKTLHHFGAGLLIGVHDIPVIFGIKLVRQPGGVDQIAEHHGELPALGIRHVQCGWWGFRLGALSVLDGWLLCWLRR